MKGLDEDIDDIQVQLHALVAATEKVAENAGFNVPEDLNVIEIDFSDYVFSSSKVVNDFYDAIELTVQKTGWNWYFMVNYRDCRTWPEAWVVFAHRGKRVKATCSLGTVHYVEVDPDDNTDHQTSNSDPDMFGSRTAALARVEEMKAEKA